jgi:hypothetical protein
LKSYAWIVFIPYVFMVLGIPFVNRDSFVLGMPLLQFWILLWVLLSPVFIGVYDLFFRRNQQEQQV